MGKVNLSFKSGVLKGLVQDWSVRVLTVAHKRGYPVCLSTSLAEDAKYRDAGYSLLNVVPLHDAQVAMDTETTKAQIASKGWGQPEYLSPENVKKAMKGLPKDVRGSIFLHLVKEGHLPSEAARIIQSVTGIPPEDTILAFAKDKDA